MTAPTPHPEVAARRAANRLTNANRELAALRAVAADFNMFTDNDVLLHTRAAITAAEKRVRQEEQGPLVQREWHDGGYTL